MPNANSPADEFWSWQGADMGSAVSLQQSWLNIATLGGSRFGIPPLRGGDQEVPFRAGMSWRPKFPGPRVVTLVMWAAGIDQVSGSPATDQRLAWNNNWQQIRAMFWQRNSLGSTQGSLTRRWYITQAGTPQIVSAVAQAEVSGSMEPSMTGRFRSAFSVDLMLADPYFYGATATATVAPNAPTVVTSFGEGVAGEATGVMSVTFTGPLTSPTLINLTQNVGLTLGISVGAGHSVAVDCVGFNALDDSGVRQDAFITHTGSRAWMTLGKGANTMLLSSLAGTDTGSCSVSYQPPYI